MIERLGDLLVPEPLGDDRFRLANTTGGWARLFGGQVVAQALAAATATVGEDRLVNSFHAYFLRDRQSERRFGPVCHRCVVELIYRLNGFCDVDWSEIDASGTACDWCDVLLVSEPIDDSAQSHERS